MNRDVERLHDIHDAIARIEKYAAKGRQAFESDELIQVWIIHHIQIIGEAARQVSDGLRKRFTNVPWSLVIGMRNILVHDYFGIDLNEVWSAVEGDMPDLRREVNAILQELEKQQ